LAVNEDDPEAAPESIRACYQQHGAEGYYRAHAEDYANPHEPDIRHAIGLAVERWKLNLARVLDLAAGSGEATLALAELGAKIIEACDPFLFRQYERRTGRRCERFSFEDVAAGALAGRAYDLIVCSFALHLADESRLPGICQQLGLASPALLILTPHKRPDLRPQWGWTLKDEYVWARVRCRLYHF
jgi:hypothetical protein